MACRLHGGRLLTWRMTAVLLLPLLASGFGLLTPAAAPPHSCATPARASARAFSAAFMA